MAIESNEMQGTPSRDELEAQIKADEAARDAPEEETQVKAEEVTDEVEETEEETQQEEVKAEDTEFEKRIARLAYEKRTAEKQNRILQERLDRLEGKAPALTKDAEIQEQVERRAAQLTATNAYNSKANEIYQAGLKEYPDFEVKLTGLRELGGVSPELVEAAVEVGDPQKIIYYLSKNLDEAERIVSMKPHQMGAALGRIAAKLAAQVTPPKAVSKVPAPIKPIAGKGKAEQNDETMDIGAYMAKEDERWSHRRRR